MGPHSPFLRRLGVGHSPHQPCGLGGHYPAQREASSHAVPRELAASTPRKTPSALVRGVGGLGGLGSFITPSKRVGLGGEGGAVTTPQGEAVGFRSAPGLTARDLAVIFCNVRDLGDNSSALVSAVAGALRQVC